MTLVSFWSLQASGHCNRLATLISRTIDEQATGKKNTLRSARGVFMGG
jgi:hypothetical protein